MCQTLMSHSKIFTKANMAKQANMSYGLLNLDWSEDKQSISSYNASLRILLKNWMDNETNPLERIENLIKTLPEEVANLKKPNDTLLSLPAITKLNFPLLLKKIFEGVLKGTSSTALNALKSNTERITLWHKVFAIMKKVINICTVTGMRTNYIHSARYIPQIIKVFLAKGIPILEDNLKVQSDVQIILKNVQECTTYLHKICVTSNEKKDAVISKLIPALKQVTEQLVYRVKGLFVLNKSSDAFWMGNLINKNLMDEEINSQNSLDSPEINPDGTEEINNISDKDEDSSLNESELDSEA